MLSKGEAKSVLADLLPGWKSQVSEAHSLDAWLRGSQESDFKPNSPTREYLDLQGVASTPWAGLVVTTVAQNLYVEGYRAAKERENSPVWNELWQPNGFDSRQIAVHRAAIAHGLSYVTVLPGTDPLTGEARAVMRGVSAKKMAAFYQDEGEDDFPVYTVRGDVSIAGDKKEWLFRLYDDTHVYFLKTEGDLTNIEYIDTMLHGVGVNPAVRFANELDLDGDAHGEIGPFIPLFSRIDKDTFDRLIVQRFGAWKVRYAAGMAKPATDEERRAAAYQLEHGDLLVSTDPTTKFGTLDETPLDGYIKARDADIRDLAAVSQTPPQYLLGQITNVSAEGLAAAEAGLMRKIEERKHSFGESWEQVLRLGGFVSGKSEAAADWTSQVKWRDTESRSLAQSADALGKLATMLQVPVEMLWDRIPGWTDKDTEDAKKLIEEHGGLDQLFASLTANAAPNEGQPGNTGKGDTSGDGA